MPRTSMFNEATFRGILLPSSGLSNADDEKRIYIQTSDISGCQIRLRSNITLTNGILIMSVKLNIQNYRNTFGS